MAPDRFDDPRLTVMGLFIEAYQGLIARLDAVHAAHGLSGSDFDALIRLARSPGRQLRMTDLAAQTALSTSGITRIVDRLERAGLISRTRCAADRRSCFAVLTDAGEQRLAADVPDTVDAIERWFTGCLTTEQLDTLTAALHMVRDAVHPNATAGAQ
ncbi:MAG: MarR family transcriptional regulator [Pseudonocardiales bacterium]|jgi:DNA-binding MarR family transcriptional regulator|nr:MarR family transcriptional regulator [Pseudonocardiales bacterium]MBV9651942.1 MarR family transcriptional regulator [Pseudonocardiales bacterium]